MSLKRPRAIILAAGFGSRLMPYTKDRPKCMVEFAGKTLLQRQIDVFTAHGITDIAIVLGHAPQAVKNDALAIYHNPDYQTTNMLYSLMQAREWLEKEGDVIISYGDIVYNPDVLESVLSTPGDIVVSIDRSWKDYWQIRMENPLSDAETLKINNAGYIQEIGKKPTSYTDIEGQYIGLQKWNAGSVNSILNFYDSLDRHALYDAKSFHQMYMTSFLQNLIDNNFKLTPSFINNGWLEVDTVEDLTAYETLYKEGGLSRFYNA